MTKRDKLLKKLKNNPRNVKFSEIETLLGRFGFVLARITGSHHVFIEDTQQITVVIPMHGNHVKTQYVKEVLDILDNLLPASGQLTDDSAEGEDSENDQDN